MNFQLSPELDKNKIFLVKRNELEGRLDCEYYKSSYKEMVYRINSANETGFLYKIASVLSGATPAKSAYSDNKTNYPIIKVKSYRGDFIALTKVDYTKEVNTSNAKKGDIYILSSAHQASYVGRFMKYLDGKPKSNTSFVGELLCVRGFNQYQKYLFYILNTEIYKTLINREKRGQTSHIYSKDIRKIKIPIPPKEIQNEIVTKMDAAYVAKKQKEAEAQRLLDGIDDYLLGELGIELPEQAENILQSRIFIRQLSEISGGRFDPDYFQRHYRILQNSLQGGYFECKTINEITDLVANGNTPESSSYSDIKTDFPIIKVRSYDGYLISLKKMGFTNRKKSQRANQHDIFVLSAAHQSSYVGRFLKFLDEKPAENTSFVGELICIRSNPFICNPMYLFSLLNMETCKVLLNREKTGQTSHIYPKDIKHIKIPIPSLEKQTEIANHISAIRTQAKQLQQQAKAGLAQAKKEVEAMILGEDANQK